MQKLIAVEKAKTLMNEAKDWSIWHWLLTSGGVPLTYSVDGATNTLVTTIPMGVGSYYIAVNPVTNLVYTVVYVGGPSGFQLYVLDGSGPHAEQARLDAEATFDEAERRLSADMARQGAQKAIDSWALREKAIRRAEALARRVVS